MTLTSISLSHFRTYENRQFDFSHKATVFIGPNAVGKTNIMEAIVLLAVGRSFRASKDEEMIAFDEEFGRIKAILQDVTLEILLSRGMWQGKKVAKKRFFVNGIARRRKDFLGKLKVVLFEPQDIELVIGSPGRKRDYLNFVLSQVDLEYDRCLSAYEKGLRQRNKLLAAIAENRARPAQLEYWNRLLVKNGEIIAKKRGEYLEYLSIYCSSVAFHEQLFSNVSKDKLQLPVYEFKYQPSPISAERLASHETAEIASKTTLIGPHRDTFSLSQGFGMDTYHAKDYRDLSLYGSRGEQRLAVLALKLGELMYIIQKTNERPLLLLDDIFSELDQEHQAVVMRIVNKQQTIMTTTDAHFPARNDQSSLQVIELQ